MVAKPRHALVLAAGVDARLAVASMVLITTKFIQPVKFTEFLRKAPGKFDARVMSDVEAALKRWLKL